MKLNYEPGRSRRLPAAAIRLGVRCRSSDVLPAPALEDGGVASECVRSQATLRQAINYDVIFCGLEVGQVYILEQLNINVGGNDRLPLPLTQPSCH